MRLSLRSALFLLVDVALLAASFIQLPYLLDRARAPFVVAGRGDAVVVESIIDFRAAPGLVQGDTVVSIAGHPVARQLDVEIVVDPHAIGDTLGVTIIRGSEASTVDVVLLPFFALRYALIVLLVGVVTWCVGVFVNLARPRDGAAAAMHRALVLLAVALMMMWGSMPRGDWWPLLARALYFMSYMGVATMFFFFTTVFPRPASGSLVKRALLINLPGLLVALATMAIHMRILGPGSALQHALFHSTFMFFKFVVLLYVAAGVLNFVRGYRRTESPEEKKKLAWILWALTIGPAPFFALVIVPEFFVPVSPVPEEFTLIFFLVIPLAFAIALLKYHLLDVHVVINRTTVYGTVITFLLIVYAALVGLVAAIAGSYSVESSGVAAILIALAFDPIRRRVQKFVDRRFFRVRYDFRQAERRFVERLKNVPDISRLGESLVQEIEQVIPVRWIAFLVMEDDGGGVRLVAGKNLSPEKEHSLSGLARRFRSMLDAPHALPDRVEPGVRFHAGDPEAFKSLDLVMVFPMQTQQGAPIACLALGQKLSGGRYSSEDVDLLSNVTTHAELELERILLQRHVIREQEEALRQKALNDMKTEFVRTVSHDLKNPLAATKMYAELLRPRIREGDRKAKEFLEAVGGEVDRLDRMVSTILDTARIERGAFAVEFADADLGDIAKDVLRMMEYQLKSHGFVIRRSGLDAGARYPVRVDRDAVTQALVNIVANAIKYSAETKYLHVSLRTVKGWVRCSFEDRGIGISADALPHVFTRYYRDPRGTRIATGVGLGLPLVKHVMEEHGGTVTVQSTPEKGSVFTLQFPRRNTNVKNKGKDIRR